MSAATVLQAATEAGLRLTVTDHGTIRIEGPPEAKAHHLPVIKANKAELMALLACNEGTAQAAVTPLTANEEALIRAWLAYIQEPDAEVIADVLGRCRADPGTRAYFLNCANTSEVIALQAEQAAREAAAERAAILEIDGGLSRIRAEKAAALFGTFYTHLMGVGKETNCCYAPIGRYCHDGKRLRDLYYEACS